MASISELILKQVKSAAGNVNLWGDLKDKGVDSASESILGSLTQTASKSGGIDQIKNLVTGKESAESSSITSLAGKLLSGKLSGRGLSSSQSASVSNLVPKAMSLLSNVIKDQDGDGDVDLNDILLSLKSGNSGSSSMLGAASKVLGSFLKKK